MYKLNLPDYSHQLKIDVNNNKIFDYQRKKYVALTPEEWVRQNIICHLINLGFPNGLIAVEQPITYNSMNKRCDIVVYNSHAYPKIIIECKAPHVKISQKTFDQIATYNLKLHVDYLIVTNGINHYCCKIDITNGNVEFLQDFPSYNMIK